MINQVQFKPENGGYAYDLDLFSSFGDFLDLQKGVTILFGDNGCGKSTLLEMIAQASLTKKDWPEYQAPRSEFVSYDGESLPNFTPQSFTDAGKVGIEWNGALTYYRDSTTFAQEFGLGNKETQRIVSKLKGQQISRGQSSFTHLHAIRDALLNPQNLDTYELELKDLEGQRITQGDYFEFAKKHFESWKSYFRAQGDMATPTYLLDEPDAHLGFASSMALWNMIGHEAQQLDAQILIATHSPLPLFCKDFQIISFDQEYTTRTKQLFKDLTRGDFTYKSS